ncbi:MAG: gfo/Idh/MocA family oxidoreductase, partial [Chitinophagaceae bacterium]
EAFANHYRNFALTVNAKRNNEQPTPEMLDFPTISDGVRGMRFIERVVASSHTQEKWISF